MLLMLLFPQGLKTYSFFLPIYLLYYLNLPIKRVFRAALKTLHRSVMTARHTMTSVMFLYIIPNIFYMYNQIGSHNEDLILKATDVFSRYSSQNMVDPIRVSGSFIFNVAIARPDCIYAQIVLGYLYINICMDIASNGWDSPNVGNLNSNNVELVYIDEVRIGTARARVYILAFIPQQY